MRPKRNLWLLIGLAICLGTMFCTATLMLAAWFWLVPKAGGYAPNMPPPQYQGDARLTVHFTKHAKVLCAIMKSEPGSIACAGVNGDWAIVPNPCYLSEARVRGTFANVACHEKAHSLGWSADHPRK